MRQPLILLPNSIDQAFSGIDAMQHGGSLSERAASLLKSLYARGWEDGIALLESDDLLRDTSLTKATLDFALYELFVEGLIRWRGDAHSEVIELPALANIDGERWPSLAWWRYCVVNDDQEAA